MLSHADLSSSFHDRREEHPAADEIETAMVKYVGLEIEDHVLCGRIAYVQVEAPTRKLFLRDVLPQGPVWPGLRRQPPDDA